MRITVTSQDRHGSEFKFPVFNPSVTSNFSLPLCLHFPMCKMSWGTWFIPKLPVKSYSKDRTDICSLAGILCLLMRLTDSHQENMKPSQDWLALSLITFVPWIALTTSELAKSHLFNKLFWQPNNNRVSSVFPPPQQMGLGNILMLSKD